jgi:hypothetical protein
MAFQNSKSPNFKSFGTPNLGVSKQNDIWMQPLWLISKNTTRGKVVASPKFGRWWVLWVHVCPWLVCAPTMFQLCTNQLIVWFVQVNVNSWPTCHSSSSPFWNSNTPFLPPKCCKGTYPDSFCCFHVWTRIWVFQKVWGCVITTPCQKKLHVTMKMFLCIESINIFLYNN